MSNILNKSNHPVEVKRIELRIWKLRDEIESAIQRRIEERPDKSSEEIDITDIKNFYLDILNSGEVKEGSEAEEGSVDSSGNEMDDDAMAMMAALGDGEESDGAEEDEGVDEDGAEEVENNQDTSESDDDAAAALAAQMLSDQGPEASSSEQKVDADEEKEVKDFKRSPPHNSKIVEGFVLLSDIQMDQIILFAKDNFIHGQNIVVKFLVPQTFSTTTEVLASANIARNSKIISQLKPKFRLQCQFKFSFPGERAQLREFLQSVEPDIPAPSRKLKRPTGDDEDDFDDLGF